MPGKNAKSSTRSILNGVDGLIDLALGLKGDATLGRTDIGKPPHHKHIKSCQRLSERLVTVVEAAALVAAIYEKIHSNWKASPGKGSDQNWRFAKQKRIAERNKDPETWLERMIVNRPKGLSPDTETWVNQVPIASGLTDPHADGSRRIDLVRDCGDGTYDFVELKVEDATPLYAAMEILKYGLVYALCRKETSVLQLKHKERPLLQAKGVHLRVLAPAKYYADFDLARFEASLDKGIAAFGAQKALPFEMDFKFETLSVIGRSEVKWKNSQ
jgi:hypothetical protein